jgi:predicted N-acyltransferase
MKIRIVESLDGIAPADWDALAGGDLFLSHAYLNAMHASGSAAARTGWQPNYLTLWQDERIAAAIPLYRKRHSFGEFVFDWAWAEAYARQGLDYYPKLVAQVPFTPVTGCRILSIDAASRRAAIAALWDYARDSGLSSLHVLFPTETEAEELASAGMLLRRGVQFHWRNEGWPDFEAFLASLSRDKRKKIRQERRRVADQGITLRRFAGKELTEADWRFFYECYCHTYRVRGREPYLSLDFFERIGRLLPKHVLMVLAERDGQRIATSLCLHDRDRICGRYWGAVADVPCLHFETCYYQPLEYCLERGVQVFEGGAQGEHKLARGFLPVATLSAHWLAEPRFHAAIARFLRQEELGMQPYVEDLQARSPFKAG